MGGLHEDPIERSNIMGKITKKKLDKEFKQVYSKKFRKKVQELVKEAAKGKLGEDGSDCVVLDDVSIMITSENPNSLGSSATSKSNAAAGCFYYCYVIGGSRICRKICY